MKKISLFVLMVCVAVMVFAAPAYRKPFIAKQSDGTALSVVLMGDEAVHYFSTLDGKPLVKEVNGDFSYATFADGSFVSTKCLAHDKGRRGVYEQQLLSSIDYDSMNSKIAAVHKMRSGAYRAAASKAGSHINPMGDVNVAVVLVEFPDCKFTYTKEQISDILNTENHVYVNPIANSIGSARDYFIAQSDGKFRPNFIVTDIVTLSNNMAYYGGNDASDSDKKPTYMVKEGIQKANATFDFSVCDNNGDGEVEFIYCIYAGYSESYGADANTVWPHQWQLSAQSGTITVDGVKCDTYACSGELVMNEEYESEIGKVLAGIGLIVHEFSHCLGLHDIYDTTYESGNWGMDYWDVMDQGNYAAEGYVPVGYSAYQRDFCGWRELVVLDKKGSYSMEPLTQGGTAYKVINDANADEYYILENRKQEKWDTYLFNSGMLVVHVDYNKTAWNNNEINTVAGHPRYTIIPADNKLAVYGEVSSSEFVASLKGDVWPGTSGNTELTNSSVPAAKVYKGGYMNKPITNIKYENSIISFDFMAGVFAGVPNMLDATEVTETSFVANWEPVEGATLYMAELYKVVSVADGAGDAESLLSEDFLGCSKSNTEIKSSDIDDFLSVPGWTGSKIYSENGVIRVGTSSNAGELKSPLLTASGDVTVEFKVKLFNTNDTCSVLTVALQTASGETIASEDVTPNAAMNTVELQGSVDGAFYVVFSTASSTGKKRASVDDVNITVASSVKKEKVAEVKTTATSCMFDGLETGATYMYRVCALDEAGASGYSAYSSITLLATSIGDIVAENAHIEVYTLSGTCVYAGDKSALPILPNSIYVIKSGSAVKKLLVK